jgi:hypothetical protein
VDAPAATLASILPVSGPAAGGTAVVGTGTGFIGATGVTVGGVAATAVSVVNATTINFTTPAGTIGDATVVVLHPSGNGTLVDGFEYV